MARKRAYRRNTHLRVCRVVLGGHGARQQQAGQEQEGGAHGVQAAGCSAERGRRVVSAGGLKRAPRSLKVLM